MSNYDGILLFLIIYIVKDYMLLIKRKYAYKDFFLIKPKDSLGHKRLLNIAKSYSNLN